MVQSCSIPVSVAKRATKTTLAGRPIKLGKKKRHQPPLALCSLAMPPSSFKAALICELTGWPTLSRRWRVNLRSAENRTPGAVLMDWAMAWWWMSKAFTPSGSSSQTKYPPWGSVIRVPFGKKRSISALATVCWDCNGGHADGVNVGQIHLASGIRQWPVAEVSARPVRSSSSNAPRPLHSDRLQPSLPDTLVPKIWKTTSNEAPDRPDRRL